MLEAKKEMDQQIVINFWDFCTLNPDTPTREPVVRFNTNPNLPSTILNGHLKTDPVSTPTLGAAAI